MFVLCFNNKVLKKKKKYIYTIISVIISMVYVTSQTGL